jgi:hypothetical protein
MHQSSTAPSGAQCARHPGVAAPLVCGRCGAFMCAECSLGGSESLCPACRELVGSDGFPYRRDDFDFSRLWNHALEAFQRDWVMLSVGALIYFALNLGGSLLASALSNITLAAVDVGTGGRNSFKGIVVSALSSQVFGTLIGFVVQGVSQVGFYRLTMDAVIGRRVAVARMFSQLRKLPTFVLTQLIIALAAWTSGLIILGTLGLVAFKLAGLNLSDLESFALSPLLRPAPLAILMVGCLGLVAFYIYALLPLQLFVGPEIVVSDVGAVEAVRRAWNTARGMRLTCIGYSFVFGLLVLIGSVLCILPVFPATALGTCLLVSLFLAARNGSGLPAPDHT